MPMKQWLIKRIKKLCENVESTITNVIVITLLSCLGGSIYFLTLSKKTLNYFLQIATIPTPLWATIALVLLCCGYIYLKQQKRFQSSKPPDYKIIYFPIDNLKWKTKIYDNGNFEVERISICKEHDLPLINDNIIYYCPESIKNNCKNNFASAYYSVLFVNAKSYIDKEVRNKTKC